MPAPAFAQERPEHTKVNGVLPMDKAHVQQFNWESRYGMVLIEVKGPEVFVNGCRVEPAINEGLALQSPSMNSAVIDVFGLE